MTDDDRQNEQLPPYEYAEGLLDELDEISDPWEYDEIFEEAFPDWGWD